MSSRPPILPRPTVPAGWPAARKKLLAWFDRHQRKLPWRDDRNSYRVWVSEVMLQQTTVAVVIRYFERFLQAFPTVQSLATADEQAVLKQWEGLGYYRRARHLQAAAKRVVTDHGGTFTNDPELWASLPGVGRYILGAVLSQAYGLKYPIVEANTLRVLARLFGYRNDPRVGKGKAWVWAAAEAVLPRKRVGDFNQAMMELGALVCTPSTPRCPTCPLAKICVAHRRGLQSRIPPRKRPTTTVASREVAVAIRNAKGRVLVGRRPATARWAGMWEFPHGEIEPPDAVNDTAVRVSEKLVGLRVTAGAEFAAVTQTVTRCAISTVGVEARAGRGQPKSDFFDELRWVEPNRLTELPASTTQRKLFAELVRAGRQLRLC